MLLNYIDFILGKNFMKKSKRKNFLLTTWLSEGDCSINFLRWQTIFP